MTTTFETAKVGDKVWCMVRGWGEVRELEIKNNDLVDVYFPSLNEYVSYTFDGIYYERDTCRTLFWDEVVIEAPQKPLPKLEVDTKVIVWNRGVGKVRRHFSHFTHEGKIVCFDYGMSSWTTQNTKNTTEWNEWELAELQPLSENQ